MGGAKKYSPETNHLYDRRDNENGISCSEILVYEIRVAYYGGWSNTWNDVVENQNVINRVNLMLYFLQTVYENSGNQGNLYRWYLETVCGKYDIPYSYRIWILIPRGNIVNTGYNALHRYSMNLSGLQTTGEVRERTYGRVIKTNKQTLEIPRIAYQNLKDTTKLCEAIKDYLNHKANLVRINTRHDPYSNNNNERDKRQSKRRKYNRGYAGMSDSDDDEDSGCSSSAINDTEIEVPFEEKTELSFFDVFSPKRLFERMEDEYKKWGVDSRLSNYIEINGRTKTFIISKTSKELDIQFKMRRFNENNTMIIDANQLCEYYLPTIDVNDICDDEDLIEMLGGADNGLVEAPGSGGNKEKIYHIKDLSMLGNVFENCYPVIARLKYNIEETLLRCQHNSDQRIYYLKMVAMHSKVLFNGEMKGVPYVFHEVLKEFNNRKNGYPNLLKMTKLRSDRLKRNKPNECAVKMFFGKLKHKKYTPFAITTSKIMTAIKDFQLTSPQIKLVYFLYMGSFVTASNSIESNTSVVAIGPKETGKSVAGQIWLQLMPLCMQLPVDYETSKIDTIDLRRDNKYVFRDDNTAKSEENEIRSQTADSNGVIVTNRVIVTNGKMETQYIAIPQRCCKCTNMNRDDRSEPRTSRDVTINVPRCRYTKDGVDISTSALNSQHDQIEQIKRGRSLAIRLSSCTHAFFWMYCDIGCFSVDTQMVKIFKLIMNKLTKIVVGPREMKGIRKAALSNMVRDLTAQWWQDIDNIDNATNTYEEIKFYRENAYVKMEHVIHAAHNYLQSSSDMGIRTSVIKLLREKISDGNFRISDELTGSANQYYVLPCTMKELKNALFNRCEDLGQSVVERYFERICSGTTESLMNIKYTAAKPFRVMVNIGFMAKNFIREDYAIMRCIQKHMDSTANDSTMTADLDNNRCFILDQNNTNVLADGRDKENSIFKNVEIDSHDIRWFRLIVESMNNPNSSNINSTFMCIKPVSEVYVREYFEPGYDTDLPTYLDVDEQKIPYVKKRYADDPCAIDVCCINIKMLRDCLANDMTRSELSGFYRSCLTIAGGYDKKSINLGFDPTYKNIEMHTHSDYDDDWCCVIQNPDYCESYVDDTSGGDFDFSCGDEGSEYISDEDIMGNMDMNTLDGDSSGSEIFDVTIRNFTWSAKTCIEKRLRNAPGRKV